MYTHTIYTCKHIQAYVHTCTHIQFIHVNTYKHTHARAHTHKNMTIEYQSAHAYAHAYVHAYMHAYLHAYVYTTYENIIHKLHAQLQFPNLPL